MPFLIVGTKRLPLRPGRNVLGGDDAQAPTGHAQPFAVIEVGSGGAASISTTRKDVGVMVNGAAIGSERVPLTHGARIDIGGRKLTFADENHRAPTPIPSSDTSAALVGPDGKRYVIPSSGLDLGRDLNCDVVIAADDVSRWHAQIAVGPNGYQLRDTSTNGVFVNGQRVLGERWLAAGDTIRVGAAQFRFEGGASTSLSGVATLDTDQLAAFVQATKRQPTETPRPNDTVRLSRTAASAAPEPPLLATLEIVDGKRFRITRPLVHVGRSTRNDIVITDKSVSSSHAKLDRRGSAWYVIDDGSKNGTHVDGKRVTGEQKLGAECELRFGRVTAHFRAVASGGGVQPPPTGGVVGLMDERIEKKPRR
jgi:pSer/pThr/pTyr-binding forkhead associated (FHA) protein